MVAIQGEVAIVIDLGVVRRGIDPDTQGKIRIRSRSRTRIEIGIGIE